MPLLHDPCYRHEPLDPEPGTVWHFQDAAGYDDYALSDKDYDDLWALYSSKGVRFWVTAEDYVY